MQKLFFLATVVVLAYTTQTVHTQDNPIDFWAIAEHLLKQLRSEVEQEIRTSVGSISLLADDLIALGKAVTAPAEAEIQTMVDRIVVSINNLEAEAENLGYIDLAVLANCTDEFLWEIPFLQTTVNTEIQQCVNDTVNQGIYFVENYLKQSDEAINEVNYLENQLEICKLSGDHADSCVVSLVSVIGIARNELPARVREEVIKARAIVDALRPTMRPCALDRIHIVEDEGKNIVNRIRTCSNMPPVTGL